MPAFGQTTAKEWFDKGNVSFQQGKYYEALQAFDKAVELNSSDAVAWGS
jgi:tetratricopeptide (TPR) repeat protein